MSIEHTEQVDAVVGELLVRAAERRRLLVRREIQRVLQNDMEKQVCSSARVIHRSRFSSRLIFSFSKLALIFLASYRLYM